MSEKSCVAFFVIALCVFFSIQSASAASAALKSGMSGDAVTRLQKDLHTLGYMGASPTGYFGDVTKAAVVKFQKKYGLEADGIAGSQTLGKLDKLLDRTAATTASRGSSGSIGEKIVDYAKRFLGVQYIWGGTTAKGFDCSGFVKYVYDHFGISLNRVSSSQAKEGTSVKKANLLPGDLVFFDTNGGRNYINHVGIYVGGGKFIQASSGYSEVVISSISDGFYSNVYMTARRIAK